MYKESNVSVKYRELLALAQGIQIMEGQAYEKKDGVSVKIYHKLSKNRQSILTPLKSFDDNRLASVNKYGRKNKKGELMVGEKMVKFTKTNKKKFDDELNKLMDETTNVTLYKLFVSELEGTDLACCKDKNPFLPVLVEYLISDDTQDSVVSVDGSVVEDVKETS